MSKIRVMIVEDSAVVRALLEHIIGLDSRLEVAATASSGEEALRMLTNITPDVIAMDIRLPGMDGIETTRRIMSRMPIPIVVVAANVAWKERCTTTVEALRAGALSVLEKPRGVSSADYETLAERLCTQLVIMSDVKLVRQYIRREPLRQADAGPSFSPGSFAMLGVACSTGGPAALVQLLRGLGPSFPLPILIVQHMGANFITQFASWLEGACPFSVVVAKGHEVPAAHTVHLAPADRHMCVANGRLYLDSAGPVCGQRPSGSVLFQSMAQSLGGKALGVLLTGMGQDGATGLHAIRQAGGYTLAQDESTCAVYGMPAAAIALDAVCQTLPLGAIAPRVLELASTKEMDEWNSHSG